jgi:C1A family cysteine protease
VTPIKDQGEECESCVAFATMAVMETCFIRQTGRHGDYSEQELIDCAYGDYGANGCSPTDGLTAYLEFAINYELLPSSEEQYPYRYNRPRLTCPDYLEQAPDLAARPTDFFSTMNGTEIKLKTWVAQYGAVITAVMTNEAFRNYRQGVFSDCEEFGPHSEVDHAVTVVGYGSTRRGQQYWLIKNSWGVDWGEKGYMRLERGVGRCGIGRYLAGVICEKVTFEEEASEEEYYYEEEEYEEEEDEEEEESEK